MYFLASFAAGLGSSRGTSSSSISIVVGLAAAVLVVAVVVGHLTGEMWRVPGQAKIRTMRFLLLNCELKSWTR